MTLKLPRISATPPDWAKFQVWWQQVCEAIERNEAAQSALFDELETQLDSNSDAVRRLAILSSYTIPTLTLSAADAGTDVTITIAAHVRQYGDSTSIGVAGGTITGLGYSTTYAVYYDDETREDVAPVYAATTDLETAQANYESGRHYVGTVPAPAALGSPATGGAPPPGSGYTAGSGGINIS